MAVWLSVILIIMVWVLLALIIVSFMVSATRNQRRYPTPPAHMENPKFASSVAPESTKVGCGTRGVSPATAVL